MLSLIQQGGFGAYPVVLFGLISLVTAALFVWRPDRRKLAYLRGMTTATVFAVLTAVAAGAAVTLHTAAGWEDPEMMWWQVLLMGLGETLASAILGFAILAIVWMLTAFGLRRLEAE